MPTCGRTMTGRSPWLPEPNHVGIKCVLRTRALGEARGRVPRGYLRYINHGRIRPTKGEAQGTPLLGRITPSGGRLPVFSPPSGDLGGAISPSMAQSLTDCCTAALLPSGVGIRTGDRLGERSSPRYPSPKMVNTGGPSSGGRGELPDRR